jgi:hypothetical protein
MTADAFRILHSHCSLPPAKILNPADDDESCLSFVERFSSCYRANAGNESGSCFPPEHLFDHDDSFMILSLPKDLTSHIPSGKL